MTQHEVKILSGLPGSGKSTYAKTLEKQAQNEGSQFKIFSADLFFFKDGEYKFDISKIGEAHAWCFRQYCYFLQETWEECVTDRVTAVVDNTNLSAWEIAPYVQAANAWEFKHKIITIKTSPDVAFKRQVHGVPLLNYMKMYANFITRQLPPFWNTESVGSFKKV